jgi:hypothetical protein
MLARFAQANCRFLAARVFDNLATSFWLLATASWLLAIW